jgi:uncharacterized protein YlxW (UPF0749 family)
MIILLLIFVILVLVGGLAAVLGFLLVRRSRSVVNLADVSDLREEVARLGEEVERLREEVAQSKKGRVAASGGSTDIEGA